MKYELCQIASGNPEKPWCIVETDDTSRSLRPVSKMMDLRWEHRHEAKTHMILLRKRQAGLTTARKVADIMKSVAQDELEYADGVAEVFALMQAVAQEWGEEGATMTDGGPRGGTLAPKVFNIGDNTMTHVFAPLGITDVSNENMQALWDRIEVMLSAPLPSPPLPDLDGAVKQAFFVGHAKGEEGITGTPTDVHAEWAEYSAA